MSILKIVQQTSEDFKVDKEKCLNLQEIILDEFRNDPRWSVTQSRDFSRNVNILVDSKSVQVFECWISSEPSIRFKFNYELEDAWLDVGPTTHSARYERQIANRVIETLRSLGHLSSVTGFVP